MTLGGSRAMRSIASLLFTCLAISAAASPFGFELKGGGCLGLDRALRGVGISATLSLGSGKLVPGIRARLDYDASLGPLIAGAELSVAVGDEVALLVGGELPLSDLSLETQGSRIALSPRPWPNRFGISALLAKLAPGAAGRPACRLETEFSWSAYGIEAGSPGEALPAAVTGVAGFAAGFRAFIFLALSWRP